MARPTATSTRTTDAPRTAAPAVSRSDLIFLRLAAQKSQLPRLQQLLDKGVPVDTVLDSGATALVLAAQSGHVEAVDMLLQHGADVFAQRTDNGATALVVAISGEHTTIVKRLLDRRAVVTARSKKSDVLLVTLRVVAAGAATSVVAEVLDRRSDDGGTDTPPLQIEVSQGHLPVLSELLSRRDAVRWADGSLEVALRVACQASNVAMVQALLARGVNPYTRSSDGLTPLVHAFAQGNTAVVAALLDAHATAAREKVGIELFFATAESGETNVVAAVLEPECESDNGSKGSQDPPLLLQLSESHLDVVSALLEREDRAAWHGLSLEVALFAAAQFGHVELVCRLLRVQARSDFISNDGVTPLVVASANGHTEVVRALLDEGAARGWDESALALPLSVAAENGRTKVVALLIEHGAEVNTPSDDGDVLPLTLAAENNHIEVVKVLLKEDVAVEWDHAASPLIACIAAESGHEHIVAEYLDQGGDPNHRDADGVSLLHAACSTGQVAVVTLLLDRNADPDSRVLAGGATPLMIAAQDGNVDIVAALLDHGADVNATESSQGVTVLHMAAQNGHADIVELLLGHGADMNDRRRDGTGPLVLAASHGHSEVVSALLRAQKEAGFPASEDSRESALVYASQAGHVDIVRTLIGEGADVSFTSSDGVTSLAAAAQSGHAAIIEVLLSQSVELSDAVKGIALLVAAQGGHLDAVVALLEGGARAQYTTADGVTALQLAEAGAFADIASVLRKWKT